MTYAGKHRAQLTPMQAVRVFLKHHKLAPKTIHYLILWNPNTTLSQNAERMRLGIVSVRYLRNTYHLTCWRGVRRKGTKGWAWITGPVRDRLKPMEAIRRYLKYKPQSARTVGLLCAWDPKKTVPENADTLQLHRERSWSLQRDYHLTSAPNTARDRGKQKDQVLKEQLRAKGWPEASIRRLFQSQKRVHKVRSDIKRGTRSWAPLRAPRGHKK